MHDANPLRAELNLAITERNALGIVVARQARRINDLLTCCDTLANINDSLIEELDALRCIALGVDSKL